MDIVVRGRHMDVSHRFREHVTGKLARVERFGVPIDHLDVEVSFEPNPRQSDRAYEVELTGTGGGQFIRAEGHAQDKYAATDVAVARLVERLRRVADRRRTRRVEKVLVVPSAEPTPQSEAALATPDGAEGGDNHDPATVWHEGPIVVRLKEHVAEPMTIAQAVESMEMVGHDFYLFRDVEAGSAAVVYRRRGYSYGLIRLEGGAHA